MGILDFFTFKTSNQLYREEHESRMAGAIRKNAKGFDAFITDKQDEVDALKARVSGFLADVESHFNAGGVAEYLSPSFNPTVKFEDLKAGVRRMGLKWKVTEDDLDITIAFAFVEKQGEVRCDYIFESDIPFHADVFGNDTKNSRMVINDRYIGLRDEEFRRKEMYKDDFRSMRSYDTYQDFQDSKLGPPKWFSEMLKARIPRIP